MRWAIVVGIDEYGSDELRLSAAVSDALRFRDWVVSPAGGDVPEAQLRLLLGRRADDPGGGDRPVPEPTKDNVVTAIHEVLTEVERRGERAERLYVYFAGHGITARVSNRDESALVTKGFDALHTDHSLAVRSLTEHFETTPFEDQFFFVDACRNVPWEDREFEIGRWPVPRRRDPGAPPVQQFVLYATSPGRTAAEVGWPGEAEGAFTGVLMDGLEGRDDAKAWSWERNCYEVRWERLASFVRRTMTERAGTGSVQVPQDTGSRGVADRDRDPPVASFASGAFPQLELELELELEADAEYEEADVSVLDAVAQPVVSALRVTGGRHVFTLPPKTYAVRATTETPERLQGTLKAPVELYRSRTVAVRLRRGPGSSPPGETEEDVDREDVDAAGRSEPPGTIAVGSEDRLAVAEVRDEVGGVVAVLRAGEEREVRPGFYDVRDVGPEETGPGRFVVLSAGEREEVVLPLEQEAAVGNPLAAALATALGGEAGPGWIRPVAGATPAAWAQPSTVVAAAVGAALRGADLPALGIDLRGLDAGAGGVAVLAVSGRGDAAAVERLGVRVWPAGEKVGEEAVRLAPSEAGVGGVVEPVPGRTEATPYWASIEPDGTEPIVVSLTVLPGRLATLVAQLDDDRLRLHQFHPSVVADESSDPDRLRRVEHLQRMLVAGRLDGAGPLAAEVAEGAAGDPFAGLVAGYVLLRLGRFDELERVADAVAAAEPALADAAILRGEAESRAGRREAADQAFAAAVNAGVPSFAEGLTRLVEGLRVSGLVHPRGAMVRHVFQRHARGIMWAAFTPRRRLEPGRLVISGADLGYEG